MAMPLSVIGRPEGAMPRKAPVERRRIEISFLPNRLGWQSGLLPRAEPAVPSPNSFETAVQEYARQTGARGLARSGAVQNDLLIERHRIDVLLEITGWDPSRPRDHLRGAAKRLLASQVDHQDIDRFRGEQTLQFRNVDAADGVM